MITSGASMMQLYMIIKRHLEKQIHSRYISITFESFVELYLTELGDEQNNWARFIGLSSSGSFVEDKERVYVFLEGV